jgi:hypothetical protein
VFFWGALRCLAAVNANANRTIASHEVLVAYVDCMEV